MDSEEQLYLETAGKLPHAIQSQMFGKPCFKINGKAFAAYFHRCMVFKLNGAAHSNALSLTGACLFDPSGKNRPMREWVQVPYDHHRQWERLAQEAYDYVSAAN